MLILLTQSFKDATELLNKDSNDVTLIGALLFFIVLLIIGLVTVWRKLSAVNTARLEDSKENTKILLEVTDRSNATIKQLTEFLKT